MSSVSFSEGDSSKADKPVALISEWNWNLGCWFLWREENRRTRRKTLGAGTRTNNKLNSHVKPGPGIEPGPQRWEASVLTTAPSLLPTRKRKAHVFKFLQFEEHLRKAPFSCGVDGRPNCRNKATF